MYENTERHNGVNGTGTLCEGVSSGRCLVDEQHRPDCYHATARTSWNREANIAVMECYFLSKPMDEEGKPLRGYRKRITYDLIFLKHSLLCIKISSQVTLNS